MKKTMTKTLAAIAAILLLAACGKASFKVEGNITDANDSILYLENMALDGPQVVDSVKLDATGDFSLSASIPEDAPEFYRLRIGQQIVNFCVDSIAVVKVKASYPTMSSNYEIEGGEWDVDLP